MSHFASARALAHTHTHTHVRALAHIHTHTHTCKNTLPSLVATAAHHRTISRLLPTHLFPLTRFPATTATARYVYAAVLDGATDEEIPGYGVSDTLPMEDVDSLNLPLKWRSSGGTTVDTSPLAGKTVKLRIYFRDATIYAVGA